MISMIENASYFDSFNLTKVNTTNYIVTCDLLTVFSVNIKKTTFIRSLFSLSLPLSSLFMYL